jgi:drug/metabolite transporter (DMT)-like permease
VSRLGLAGAFAAIYLFWGATFLAIRYAVMEVPPLLTIAIRCIGGALILCAWLVWKGGLESTTRRQWLVSAIAGTFLFVGCHGVLAWAEQRVSSGQAALYLTSSSLWLVLLMAIRERRRPSGLVIAGLVLGVVGVAVLVSGKNTSGTLLDRLVLIATGLSWAIGSLIAREGDRPTSAVQCTAMQLAAGGVAVFALSLLAGELSGWTVHQLTSRGAGALAFLVLAGTVLGFGAYTWLLQVTTPAVLGPTLLSIPWSPWFSPGLRATRPSPGIPFWPPPSCSARCSSSGRARRRSQDWFSPGNRRYRPHRLHSGRCRACGQCCRHGAVVVLR